MAKRIRAPWWYRIAVTLVVLLALVVAGVFAWFYWWTPRQNTHQADAAERDYFANCQSIDPGFDVRRIGLMQLPGSQTWWPVLQLAADDGQASNLIWYPTTALPGQLGNMVVVGQRLVAGGPFSNILDLNQGDKVIVETCSMRYTYTVVVAPRDLTVQPGDTWVMDPVPGEQGVMPTDAYLTLIANQDITPSTDRAVGFAKLTSSKPQ